MPPPPDPDLLDDVRSLVLRAVGGSSVTRVEPLQLRRDAAVLLVTISGGVQLVVKVSGPEAQHPVRFQRTATLTALARATGAPVPEVLAADDSLTHSRWRYLVAEHVDGVAWSDVRPRLTADQLADAHRQLAAALVGVQSASFPGFGELDGSGRPPAGQGVLAALHQRAELTVRDTSARAAFQQLLDREAALFDARSGATLTHDDLHHRNVLFSRHGDDWRLVALLDWDKAWSGPAESDVARMAFWDDMTGPAFWQVYRASVPAEAGAVERMLIHQLLWCLEYDCSSPRHAADMARLRRRLEVG